MKMKIIMMNIVNIVLFFKQIVKVVRVNSKGTKKLIMLAGLN